ncbi:MAG TPA: four helix bundle protein [Hyphomicrobiaceae bacterium]|jgi:four helix bundle protein
MSPLQSYQELRVWKEAMLLAEMCYRHTSFFPKHELFGLTAQIRRAAASIPANIAEGYGRDNRGSYIQFLCIAQGSCKELETHVLLASHVLGEIASGPEPLLNQADVVGKMLRGLIRSLRSG